MRTLCMLAAVVALVGCQTDRPTPPAPAPTNAPPAYGGDHWDEPAEVLR